MPTVFLASLGLSALPEYLPAHPSDLILLFIPTAADLDTEAPWLDRDRKALTRMGFNIRELDIKGLDYEQSVAILALADVVFLAGGNTFHLLNALNESGFGEAIRQRDDLIYIGASAGAAVAGLDIAPIATLDRPEIAESLASTTGLKLVPFVVLPHYNKFNNGDHYDDIMKNYSQYEFLVLNDKEAAVSIDGKVDTVISR